MEEAPAQDHACIYCGATRYSNIRVLLGEEHVIPFALNGNLVIPQAACFDCERRINKYEAQCLEKVFGPIRYFLNLVTRNPKRRPDRLPIRLEFRNRPPEQVKVPIEDYPPVLAFVGFDCPLVLPYANATASQTIWVIRPTGKENCDARLQEIARQHKGAQAFVEGPVAADIYRKMLAKIAHAYAVSIFGRGGFVSFLTHYVRGLRIEDGPVYVGSSEADHWRSRAAPSASPHLHELSCETVPLNGDVVLLVRMRLFAFLKAPEYMAVVGCLPQGTMLPTAYYTVPVPELPPGRIVSEFLEALPR